MTTAYIPSAKDAHTMKHSTTCDTCGKTVTSVSAGGLRPAMRRHLAKYHPAIYSATAKFRVTPKVVSLPDNRAIERSSITCPYCKKEFTSTTQARVERILTNHKRVDHTHQYADEVAARVACILDAVPAEPLVSVRVAQCYYPKSALSTKYPAPKTMLVPERWHVESVFVHCAGDGRFTAYRGAMGSSESWGVGK